MIKKFGLIMLLMFTIPCHSAGFNLDIRKILIATTASFLSYISTGRSTWRSFSQTTVQKIRSILRPLITASSSSDCNLETKHRKIGKVSTISFDSVPGELFIKQGRQTSLSTTADKKDFQYLTPTVTKEELKLRLGLWARWFHYFKKSPKYVVTVGDNLNALTISVDGLDKLVLNNLNLCLLRLTCSSLTNCTGSADVAELNLEAQDNVHIKLQGIAQKQNLELSDSATYDAQNLKSDDITIAVRNTSSAKIWAYKTVKLKPGTGLIEIYNSKPTISIPQPYLLSDAGTVRYIQKQSP